MKIFEKKSELTAELTKQKQLGHTIGFVPTMGALHTGHLSLLECANQQNDISVVSVFVNPTQFNNPEDLKKYPRDVDSDIKLLEAAGCNYLFLPEVEEMYPETDTRQFDFGTLATVMEGKFRPGHFNGVGQIVSKLFDVVMPHKAYFGQKDFQQVAIIHRLVELQRYDIEIVVCPIVRHEDGLAMSSRNMRLNAQQRAVAPIIYHTLEAAKHFAGTVSLASLKEMVINRINITKGFEVEYFEIVDKKTLVEPIAWGEYKTLTACIAVYCGDIRLIDNIEFDIKRVE